MIERMAVTVKIKDSFIIKKILDDYVVVPTGEEMVNFDAMITLNETGAFLWEQLSQDKTQEQLCDALCAEYAVERDQVEQDVQDFVDMLVKAQVLQ